MTEIASNLFIGDHRDAKDLVGRGHRGIKAVLTAMHDECRIPEGGARCLRVAGPDGEGWTTEMTVECVAFLEEVHRDQGLPTLVHCWMGQSRSASVAAAYLWKNRESVETDIPLTDPESIVESIRERRDCGRTLPVAEVWAATMEFLGMADWL